MRKGNFSLRDLKIKKYHLMITCNDYFIDLSLMPKKHNKDSYFHRFGVHTKR